MSCNCIALKGCSIFRKHLAVVLIFLKRPEIIIYNHRPQYEVSLCKVRWLDKI